MESDPIDPRVAASDPRRGDMVYANLLIWARFADATSRDRLAFYLDPETRPDFPEEAPESEASWVDHFELLPDPDQIERLSGNVLLVYFGEEADAQPDQVCEAIGLLSPTQLLMRENIEGDVFYHSWQDGQSTLIYAADGLDDPDDDTRYNRQLGDAVRRHLDGLRDSPKRALQYLAEQSSGD